jgi:hypothetical protein
MTARGNRGGRAVEEAEPPGQWVNEPNLTSSDLKLHACMLVRNNATAEIGAGLAVLPCIDRKRIHEGEAVVESHQDSVGDRRHQINGFSVAGFTCPWWPDQRRREVFWTPI